MTNGIFTANIKPYSRGGIDYLDDLANPNAIGRFEDTGRFYLAPNITAADLKVLRNGGRITKPEADLFFTFSYKNDKGEVEWRSNNRVTVAAKDIERVSTFFGDRPLDNPGYSKFELKGSVGQGKGYANDRLDVYRVEQRLKYLGFPAFNYPTSKNFFEGAATSNPRKPKDFKVDGKFDKEEETAMLAFYAATHLRDTPGNPIDDKNWGISNGPSKAAQATASSDNLAWLNAYNAPHWMNIYASFGIPVSQARLSTPYFKDGTSVKFEIYGTSWMRDLLKAWEVESFDLADYGLWTEKLQLNGLTDPGYAFTGHARGNHSIGMGIDLGVGQWISGGVGGNQNKQDPVGTGNNPNIDSALAAIAGSGWSVERAKQLSEKLPDIVQNNRSINNQEQALRDFLALYALTREDAVSGNGTWDDLKTILVNKDARKHLFGDGTKAGGLISEVLIGGQEFKKKNGVIVKDKNGQPIKLNQNPYDNMNKVLAGLDITSSTSKDHHNHFHIVLRTPKLEPIDTPPKKLLADNPALEQIQTGVSEELYAAAQALVAEMQPYFNLQQGEINMFVMDMPDVPPQYAPVIIAQAVQTQQQAPEGSKKVDRTIGVCHLIENPSNPPGTAVNVINPLRATNAYVDRVEHREIGLDGKVTVLQGPKHGTLEYLGGEGYFVYRPTPDNFGSDRATFLVEIDGRKIKVVYHFKVTSEAGGGTDGYDPYMQKKNCPKGDVWKISLNPDDPNSPIYSFEMPSQLSSVYAGAFSGLTNVNLGVAGLAGGALAQTTGQSITLSPNAAGYNWFIDATPWFNEEYLPTSNPNEWVAKSGSAAEGKMDMLSVLLHEYGHALGIEHSANPHDLMASTLTPGVRRLPSTDELALMAQLVGQAKDELVSTSSNTPNTPQSPLPFGLGFAAAFIGRSRNSGASLAPQYAVAPNPSFTNPEFAGNTGWSTTGTVSLGNGAAVLTESATAQTRLNQLFVLGARDRFLRFTLSDIALDDMNSAPDDAFEVALIDANTGLSLLGGTGLTRTDALLNLQANGSERLAPGVTSTLNLDGSRNYLVDLSGIAVGTVASLSFDLIGFGRSAAATSSHITVRDVSIGVPQEARDDQATTLEDTPVLIDVRANDLGADQAGVMPVLVSGPAHGSVTITTNGSFAYTPEANWFGEDSFIYKLSDGNVDSNTALVTLTVSPVNDAPVLADAPHTTLEDTPLVLDLLAQAADVDSATFSVQIVDGPAHGVLALNLDGAYTYTPTADFNGVDSFTYRVNDGDLDSNLATVMITVASVNDAPQGTSVSVTTLEDTPYVFQVMDFGFTDTSDALASMAGANSFAAVVIGSLPLAGSLTLNGQTVVAGESIAVADIAAGLLRFAPLANANGASYASFTFQVQDDGGNVNGGVDRDPQAKVLSIDVTPVNDAPTVVDAQLIPTEDTPLVFDLLSNAYDIDSAGLVSEIVTGPANGVLLLNADGTYTYSPNANFNGADSFSYRVSDGNVASNVANVTITITPINDAPVAASVSMTTAEDTALNIELRGLVIDVDSPVVTPQIVSGPLFGTLTLNADGSYTYLPALNYFGADSFTYLVNDGLLDSNVATINLNVTPVNDASVANNDSVATAEDTPLTINVLGNDTDVENDPLTATVITGPLHGTLLQNADGGYSYTPMLNYFGADSFTYRANDGQFDSTPATVNITITQVDDAPVAASSTLNGAEDTPIVFTWANFNVTDPDSTALSIKLSALPVDGLLQYNNGSSWVAVIANQVITKADIDAGKLRFMPDANESGYSGYAAAGVGNLKQDYAQFAYQASDGVLSSATAVMSIDLVPVADTPVLTLTPVANSTELFRTGWETAANVDNFSTLVAGATLEGWTLITTPDSFGAGKNGFEIWTTNDDMADPGNTLRKVSAAAGNGANWIEINNSDTTLAQTLGIQRRVTTQLGASYTLSFDYAGRNGYSVDYTRIGIYVDGVKLATYANTSPTTSLNWQALQYTFTGKGGAQTIKFITEATKFDAGGRGALLDDIALTEQLAANTGYEDTAIRLSTINASLVDSDGSETLSVSIGALPIGATLSDGTRSFTATAGNISANMTGWTLNNLSILPPLNFNGSFSLNVVASATEAGTGVTASASSALTVTVLAAVDPVSALASAVTGTEDTVYLFTMSNFKYSDPDAQGVASITIATLPTDGKLEFLSGTTWAAVTVGKTLTATDIAAGKLRFKPDLNESGSDAFATAGVGNLKKDYAAFQFTLTDSKGVKSNAATMTIDLAPVADAPVISSAALAPFHSYSDNFQSYGAVSLSANKTQVGSWYAVSPNKVEIVAECSVLGNSSSNLVLEVEGPSGGTDLYRDFATYKGEMFTLSLSYSPRKNYTTGTDSAIDVLWEGVKIATLNTTTVGLKTYTFNVTSNSANGLSRLQFHAQSSNGYGGVVDNIVLTGKGYAASADVPLNIAAALVDTDGSEGLTLKLQALPVGTVLADGTRSFTATTGSTTADITGWTLSKLTLRIPATQTTAFTISVLATATESANAAAASTTATLTITPSTLFVSPLVLDLNGDGIRTTALGETTGGFDLLNNGVAIDSGWLSAEDGFLAIDVNGNGRIDDRSELFGGDVGDGFAKLAGFDSNADGVVNNQDTRFGELRVWQDANSNRQTDDAELRSLAEAGVASLNTGYVMKPEEQNGNLLLERGTATLSNGKTIEMADAYFRVDSASLMLPEDRDARPVLLPPSDERGASIVVQSVVAAAPRGNVGAASILPPPNPAQNPILMPKTRAPVIDWSRSGSQALNTQSTIGKTGHRKPWLTNFLGTEKSDSADALQWTGLKVTIGGGQEGGAAEANEGK